MPLCQFAIHCQIQGKDLVKSHDFSWKAASLHTPIHAKIANFTKVAGLHFLFHSSLLLFSTTCEVALSLHLEWVRYQSEREIVMVNTPSREACPSESIHLTIAASMLSLRFTKPSDEASARSELNVENVFLRCAAVLPVPCIRMGLVFPELACLPPSHAQEVQRDVQRSSVTSTHHSDEPLIFSVAGLCDNLAGLAAFQDSGLVPHGRDCADHVVCRIVQIALRMAAETEEG
jgi:hypothetical protein